MEIRQVPATGSVTPPAAPPPKTATIQPAVDAVQPPPKGGLPGSQQVLSKLTPGDRAAIAGATGYSLSPTGAVTNGSGGVPPWSFILAFAASRTAKQPAEEMQKATSDDGNHVDVTI